MTRSIDCTTSERGSWELSTRIASSAALRGAMAREESS
jgi:hypothetical protein